MSFSFLVPTPEILPASRVDLTFGLRAAMRYHREQTVPGIGGVWFVRQLSWAVAGLHLAQNFGKESPIRVANALEALACKCEYECCNHEDYFFRGKRAFARDSENDIWDFGDLVRQNHYVQITYRQSTVRALPSEIGLGFSDGSGIRFSTMQLSQLGSKLADVFLNQDGGVGRGSTSVGTFLGNWIAGESRPGRNAQLSTLCQRLSPRYPTGEESEIVLRRLESFVTGGICAGDRERRNRICAFFNSGDSTTWAGLLEHLDSSDANANIHANQLRNAKAFEDMRSNCAALLDACAFAMETEESGLSIQDLMKIKNIENALTNVAASARSYMLSVEKQGPYPQDAHAFANRMMKGKQEERLDYLICRDGRILQLIDGKVCKGPLFRTGFSGAVTDDDDEADVDDAPDEDTENPWVLSRLSQFHNLWLDCKGESHR